MTTLRQKIAGILSPALGDVTSQVAQRCEDNAEAHQRRQHLASALPPKSELIATAHQEIDRIAEAWLAQWGEALAHVLAGGVDIGVDGRVIGLRTGSLLAYGGLPVTASMIDVIALNRDAAKVAVAEAIKAVDYEPGPPMADRERLLAELDERITRLEEEHTAIVDAAAEVGITIPLLDAVQARRAMAAHRAEVMARNAPR